MAQDNIPLDKRVISTKTPYYVQEWCNFRKQWLNIRRAVNLDVAIKRYYEEMERRRNSYSAPTVSKLNKQRPIRLFDTLYEQVIADKDVMTRANKQASRIVKSWDAAAVNALKGLIAEKRKLH